MYVVYNHGFDAYLTTKGWKNEVSLKNKNKNYNLIVISKDANIQDIKDYIQLNASTITRGLVLIDTQTLLTSPPKKTLNFTNKEILVMKQYIPKIVEKLILNKAEKIKSTQFFKNNILATDPINQEPIVTDKNKKKKLRNLDDLNRIKKELKFNNDFIDDTIAMTKNVNDMYNLCKEISIYYPTILHEIDAQTQDQLHYVEFHKLNVFKAYKLSVKLHNLRIKRRIIKDKLNTANWLLANLDEDDVSKLNQVAFKLEKLGERRYFIRDPKSFERNQMKKAEIE